MKRIVISMLAAIVLTMGSGFAWAEEEHHAEKGAAEEGTEVEVGVKVWWNKWKRSGGIENFTSDSTYLLGPVAEVKFHNNMFIEAGYLVSMADYKATVLEGAELRELKVDRHDLDVAAGYMFTHEIGAFVGYRSSAMKDVSGIEETAYGPLVGIRGAVPVNEALSFYGRFTYLFNRLKNDMLVLVTHESMNGWIAEAGAKYDFTKHISATLGYQYETTKAKDQGFTDKFSGVTLGAMYAFE